MTSVTSAAPRAPLAPPPPPSARGNLRLGQREPAFVAALMIFPSAPSAPGRTSAKVCCLAEANTDSVRVAVFHNLELERDHDDGADEEVRGGDGDPGLLQERAAVLDVAHLHAAIVGPVQELVPVRQTRVRVEVLHDEGVLLVDPGGVRDREGEGEPARGVETGPASGDAARGRGRGRSLVRRMEVGGEATRGSGRWGKNRSCVVARTTRGRFPPARRWGGEGTNGPPGTERARVWGGGGSGGGGRTVEDIPVGRNVEGTRATGGPARSSLGPLPSGDRASDQGRIGLCRIGRSDTDGVDGGRSSRGVFSEGGRPSRGARDRSAAPCASLSSSWRASAVSAARAVFDRSRGEPRRVLRAVHPRVPLVGRPPPDFSPGATPRLAARLGLTRDGRVAVLTNFTERDKIPDAPSRGELPVGYLTVRHQPPPRRAEPPPGAHPNDLSGPRGHISRPRPRPLVAVPRSSYPAAYLADLAPRRDEYNGFNLLVGDCRTLEFAYLGIAATSPTLRRRRSSLPTISTTARAGRCSG